MIYLDLIFLMNLLIDAATLKTTAWARKIQARSWRIVAAAAIGAAYVMMMFVPELHLMFTFVIKLLFSVAMLLMAFGFGSLQHFYRNFIVFYLINFVAAGGIFAVQYLLSSTHDVLNGVLFTQSGAPVFPVQMAGLLVVLLFPVMLYMYRWVMKEGRRRSVLTSYFADTLVYIDGFQIQCTGLIDTGNQLYDPLTRTPVMVMDAAKWKDFLPAKWVEHIQKGETDELLRQIGNEEFRWQDRLRFIPFKGINRGSQFMLALKPDKVVITHHDCVTETEKVFIGFHGNKLCADNSYQAIVHPLLTNSLGR